MHNNKNAIIFLTGCVNPKGMTQTKLQDPEIRKTQYIDAIKFYLAKTDLRILFVENSSTDISDCVDSPINKERVEFLTFDGNNYNKDLGKGYGEMSIIEHALSYSKFLKNTEFVFKITGRYKVLNIMSFVNDYYTSNSYNLLIDLKNNLSFSDSRFLGCKPSFLSDILVTYKEQLNDSNNVFFEHALCKAAHQAIINNYKFSFLKYKPRYSGIYGTDNTPYNDSWIYWFPRNLKYKLLYKLNGRG